MKEDWAEESQKLMLQLASVLTLEEYQIVSKSLQSLSSFELKLPSSEKKPNEKPTLIFEFPKFPETAKECRETFGSMKC